MRSRSAFTIIAFAIVLSLAAAACGGQGSAKKGGGSSASSAGAGSGKASTPRWGGAQAWSDLARLTNYSYRETISVQGAGSSSDGNLVMTYEQANPHNYEAVLSGQGGLFAGGSSVHVTTIQAGGHLYESSGSGFLDVGRSGASSPISNLSDYTAAYRNMFGQAQATYLGPCQTAGRPGNSFRLRISAPQIPGVSIPGGAGQASATTCLDTATGVPMATDMQFSGTSSTGQRETFTVAFQITGIGNVAAIAAPKASQP